MSSWRNENEERHDIRGYIIRFRLNFSCLSGPYNYMNVESCIRLYLGLALGKNIWVFGME